MSQEDVKKKSSESQRVYIVSSLCSKSNRKCDHKRIEEENERVRLSFHVDEPPITYFCPLCGKRIPNAGIFAHLTKPEEPSTQYSLTNPDKNAQ